MLWRRHGYGQIDFKKYMMDTVTTLWSYGEYSEPGFAPKSPLYETVCPKKAIMTN